MSIPLTINGAVFEYPQNFDEDWGVDATGWAQAVTAGALYLSGGNFPLTAQVNFGNSFGIKVLNVTTETANPATIGYLKLSKTDSIVFRNNANSANLVLGIDGSDMLNFNGTPLGLTSLTNGDIYVGNASNVPVSVALSGDATITNTGVLTITNNAVTNAKVSTTANIAVSKLAALTASRAVATDTSGFITPSATTATELGYVNGVTSSIQAQINAIAAVTVPSGVMVDFGGIAAPTGWLLCDGSSYTTASQPSLFAAIGYSWGGSGANFNVPNMTRRVGMGSGGSGTGTIGNAVGNTGGEETHVLTTPEIPSHTHTPTDPGHAHVETATLAGGVTTSLAATTSRDTTSAANMSVNTLSATTGITIGNTGGGGAHNNVQPSAVVLKIIKT